VKVAKWGNSLAIRLPAAAVEALQLKRGDEVTIQVELPGKLVVEREMTREEAIAMLRTAGTPLPLGFKFTRDEANAR
jgi:antitoxin MazE